MSRYHAERMRDLLVRLREWDHLDEAGDGAFWRAEIDAVLADYADYREWLPSQEMSMATIARAAEKRRRT